MIVGSRVALITNHQFPQWQVKIVAASGRLVASVWRRQPGTPIYPNAVLERGFGVATTRNWNTVETICRILQL